MSNRKKKKNNQGRKKEYIGLLLFILGLLVLLSLLSYDASDPPNSNSREIKNWMGLVGAWLSFHLYNFTIGYPVLVLPFLMMYWGWSVVKKGTIVPAAQRTGYILFFALCFSIAFALPKTIVKEGASFHHEFNGLVGLFFAQILHTYLGSIGSVLILFSIMLLAFLSLTEVSISNLLYRFTEELTTLFSAFQKSWRKFYHQQKLKWNLRAKKRAIRTSSGSEDISISESFSNSEEQKNKKSTESMKTGSYPPTTEEREPDSDDWAEKQPELPFDMPEEERPPIHESPEQERNQKSKAKSRAEPEEIPSDYQLPVLDLLDEPAPVDVDKVKSQLLKEARILEEKLAIYGIEGKVVQIHPGPLITQFEVEPAQGVKISKFYGIADDLAMVMRAQKIRILAPVPGKAVVGIEIPNKEPETIYFRRVIDSNEIRTTKYKLPIPLGVDTTGKVYITDMVRMPHLLIAGATGSGKSVCLNTIIGSFLYQLTPQELRFILIDPKKLELSDYADLYNHHLITLPEMNEEVITGADNAIMILGRVWQEMEKRFNMLARANVRTLEDYNQKVESGELQKHAPDQEIEKLPYIVIIIDELADLLLVAGQEIEEPIGRLAHKARAVGIHLIVATQRPSTDVITGAIKANFPCRIAFKVFSKTDSRVVLDVNGAEQLLGRGDMLFQPPGQPSPVRLHSPFISSNEINRLIQFVAKQDAYPEYPLPEEGGEAIVEMPNGRKVVQQKDPLFYEALKLVVRHQQGSISLLQRRLRIGYARAARIIDEMEQAGFVGAFDGSKARDVIISEDDLEQMGIL